MAITATLNSLVIPPPTIEPDWVTKLVASKPQAAEALSQFVGFWNVAEAEADPALAARSDAEALAELRAFTADSEDSEG